MNIKKMAWAGFARRLGISHRVSPAMVLGGTFLLVPGLAAGSDATAGVAEIEEVKVYARRIEERLEDVPVSLSVFSAKTLEQSRVLSLQDLSGLSPSLQLNGAAPISGLQSAPTVFIRGIGQPDFLVTSDPAVGIYVDEIYVPRMVGSLYDLVDIDSVEVIRGPQGTLWGRNTIGGAISVHSARPRGGNETRLLVETGGFGLLRGRVSRDAVLGEQVNARFTAHARRQDGYVTLPLHDGLETGAAKSAGARVAVDWFPRERFGLETTLYHSVEHGNAGALRAVDLNGNAALARFTNQLLAGRGFPECATDAGVLNSPNCIGPAQLTDDPYRQNQAFFDEFGNFEDPRSDVAVSGAAVKLSWRLDSAEFRSITAYHRLDSDFQNSLTWGPALVGQNNNRVYDSEAISQELRWSGDASGGRVRWTVGAYGSDEDARERVQWMTNHPLFTLPPSKQQFFDDRVADNRSVALYGNAIFTLNPQWELTAGLRRTRETKEFSLTPNPVTAPDIAPIPGRTVIDEVDPLVSLTYRPRDGLMAYWTYSEGFRSGGFPPRLLAPPASTFEFPFYGPEYVDNHELGLKAVLADGVDRRVDLQFSLFSADYRDKQETAVPLNSSGLDATIAVQNIGDARIRGAEWQIDARLGQALRASVSLAYLDAEWVRIVGGGATGVNGILITTDKALPYAPEWAGAVALDYSLSLRAARDTLLHLDWSYTGDQQFRPENVAGVEQAAYSVANLSLTHRVNAQWDVRVGVHNAFNEVYATTGSVNTQTHGLTFLNVSRPRYGYVSASYRFGGS